MVAVIATVDFIIQVFYMSLWPSRRSYSHVLSDLKGYKYYSECLYEIRLKIQVFVFPTLTTNSFIVQ